MTTIRTLVLLALASVAVGSCGSSSTGGDIASVCASACQKYVDLCSPGTSPATCQAACTVAASASTCTNSSAIATAAQACTAKTTCADITACRDSVPACQGSGGAGGHSSSGTGGNTGGGGASGGGSCSAALQACCAATAAANQSSCQSTAQQVAAQGDTSCNFVLSTFQSTYCPTAAPAATCVDLAACCAAATGTNKSTCMTVYSAAMSGAGDPGCAEALSIYKGTYCP